MKNKKGIIIAICCIMIIALIICVILTFAQKKPSSSEEKNTNDFGIDASGNKMYEESEDIDYENAEIKTIKFTLKNMTDKKITQIYLRDNTEERFMREICSELESGKEAEIEYEKYSPVFIWDLKVVYSDGEEKTLNSLLAANILYDGAILELSDVGENIEVTNKDMVSAENADNPEEEQNVVEGEEATEEQTENSTTKVEEEPTQTENTKTESSEE